MGLFVIDLSDVGEGVAEAELVEWHVAVGDLVTEDQLLGVVMTDKAAVEVPSSVLGKVVKLCADVGDVVAVGSALVHIEVAGDGNANLDLQETTPDTEAVAAKAQGVSEPEPNPSDSANQIQSEGSLQSTGSEKLTSDVADKQPDHRTQTNNKTSTKPLAAPSVRHRARELGVSLEGLAGSGPGGRIVHADLEQFTERRAQPGGSGKQPNEHIEVVKVVGLRRKIAEKMSLSKSRIPHVTIVEEVDVQYLEELRSELNTKYEHSRCKLTILPFVMKAMVEAVREQPHLNAHYDDEAGTLSQFGGVHIGVATQTENGLVVPVLKHCEVNSLWDTAAHITSLANASRAGTANRDDLSGSTITISSLGSMGAIATTPIINHPEVAIVGINKMTIRPFWDGQQFVPRKMMNVSCSFDHRIVDGWDAAVFVQKLKTLLEKPAMLFLDD